MENFWYNHLLDLLIFIYQKNPYTDIAIFNIIDP